MVGQTFHRCGCLVSSTDFDGLDDPRVQDTPPLVRETVVSHFLGESVPESVGAIRKEPVLVQELSRLKVGEILLQRRLGQPGNGLQKGECDVFAKHCGGLQELPRGCRKRLTRAANTA